MHELHEPPYTLHVILDFFCCNKLSIKVSGRRFCKLNGVYDFSLPNPIKIKCFLNIMFYESGFLTFATMKIIPFLCLHKARIKEAYFT